LLEGTPHTRREMRQRWLNKVAQPGRVVAIGRSGRRLALVITRTHDGVTALREDDAFRRFRWRVSAAFLRQLSQRAPKERKKRSTRFTIEEINSRCPNRSCAMRNQASRIRSSLSTTRSIPSHRQKSRMTI